MIFLLTESVPGICIVWFPLFSPLSFDSSLFFASLTPSYSDSPLTLSSASTPSTCAAYCNGEIACQSWAWDSCSYKCNMYADVGRRSTGLKLCMISGVKGTHNHPLFPSSPLPLSPSDQMKSIRNAVHRPNRNHWNAPCHLPSSPVAAKWSYCMR